MYFCPHCGHDNLKNKNGLHIYDCPNCKNEFFINTYDTWMPYERQSPITQQNKFQKHFLGNDKHG